MEAIQLFKEDFDVMENRNPLTTKLLGTFIEGNGKTAQGNVSKFIDNLEPFKHYLGYNGEVYPKLKLTKIKVSDGKE